MINEYHNPSSFQFLEVSRGAQKLNQIREPLSKWQSDGDQSRVKAKELSKEAFDLQKSGGIRKASQGLEDIPMQPLPKTMEK